VTDSTVLLPGVDKHGAGYRVRMRFGAHRHTETGFPTADAANARVIVLRAMRDSGMVPTQAPKELTLQEAAEALLTRKRTTVSRKTKRPLRASGIEWWVRATRPWREGQFARLPLSLLRCDLVEDAILERAAAAAKTARDEQDALKATLRYAGQRGGRFDQALLTMERVQVAPRRRVALSVDELDLLVANAPEYARRLLLFDGTVGMRIGELFTLDASRVDLAGRTVFVPAVLCKEGTDKLIDLTLEVAILREQLLARAIGTSLVFPTKTGRPWRHFQFLRLVWYKARLRASAAWREQEGLPEDADTPYLWSAGLDMQGEPLVDGVQPHDLRATAATMMRDAGFSKEQAAGRLGHADSGQLLDRIYDVGDRRARMRKAIDALAPQGCGRHSPSRHRSRPIVRPRRARRTCGHGSPGPIRVQRPRAGSGARPAIPLHNRDHAERRIRDSNPCRRRERAVS
jgi:integrase